MWDIGDEIISDQNLLAEASYSLPSIPTFELPSFDTSFIHGAGAPDIALNSAYEVQGAYEGASLDTFGNVRYESPDLASYSDFSIAASGNPLLDTLPASNWFSDFISSTLGQSVLATGASAGKQTVANKILGGSNTPAQRTTTSGTGTRSVATTPQAASLSLVGTPLESIAQLLGMKPTKAGSGGGGGRSSMIPATQGVSTVPMMLLIAFIGIIIFLLVRK